jgi:hypothetical protein
MRSPHSQGSFIARIAAFATFLLVASVAARPDGGAAPEIRWSTIDGGGDRSTSGAIELVGTIAQHDAATATGGPFRLRGGFWPGPERSALRCPGDFDRNGSVDASDLAVLLGGWGPAPSVELDLVPDGVIDAADLAVLLGGWGPCDDG